MVVHSILTCLRLPDHSSKLLFHPGPTGPNYTYSQPGLSGLNYMYSQPGPSGLNYMYSQPGLSGPNYMYSQPGPSGQNYMYSQPGPSGPNYTQSGPSGPNYTQPGSSGLHYTEPGPSGQNYTQPGPSGHNYAQPGPSGHNYVQPGQSGPNYTQPGPSGPNYAQPGPSGQNYSQPGPSGPNYAQPGPSGPNYTQPGPSGQNYTQPGPSGQNYTQPGPSGQNYTQPGPSGQNYTQPRPSGHSHEFLRSARSFQENMVLPAYVKQKILDYYRQGLLPFQVLSALRAEGVSCCRQTAQMFWFYLATESNACKDAPAVITNQVLTLVKHALEADNETTATQLHLMLTSCGIRISLSTILSRRNQLGWIFRGSKWSQNIQPASKDKRFQWAVQHLPEIQSDGLDDVIWTDETTVQLENHQTSSGSKPRGKHLTKVHIWAGISKKGPTPIVLYESTMNAEVYINALQTGLLPFIEKEFPTSHRLMQDNDPVHSCKRATDFHTQKGINWWKTPPESPDINPIENLMHDLKEYVTDVIKPSSKSELISGIKSFWRTVNIHRCCKYINHLQKVVPRVIECQGAATGY